MVPTETLTSMLDEPSRGSISTTYFAFFTAFKDDNLIFFFRGNARNDIARFQCGFQFFISEQVEFSLNLALHVLSTAGTQDINQSCFVDIAMEEPGAPVLLPTAKQ